MSTTPPSARAMEDVAVIESKQLVESKRPVEKESVTPKSSVRNPLKALSEGSPIAYLQGGRIPLKQPHARKGEEKVVEPKVLRAICTDLD